MPPNGHPTKYTHTRPHVLNTTAGPKLRAGFMLAPDTLPLQTENLGEIVRRLFPTYIAISLRDRQRVQTY